MHTYQDGGFRAFPYWHIGGTVARINKIRSHLLLDRFQLRGAFEVYAAFRRQHSVEKAKMIENVLRDFRMRRRGENDRPAFVSLRLEVGDEPLMIGEMGGRKAGPLGNGLLESRAPAAQPKGNAQQAQ